MAQYFAVISGNVSLDCVLVHLLLFIVFLNCSITASNPIQISFPLIKVQYNITLNSLINKYFVLPTHYP